MSANNLRLAALTLCLSVAASFSCLAGNDPYVFGKTNTQKYSPYYYIGQLDFFSGRFEYIGSGTVITPKGVLTAAHNLYDKKAGFSTKVRFTRARYDSSYLSKSTGTALTVLSGYAENTKTYGVNSSRTFARDAGVIGFAANVAGGGHASYSTQTSLLTQTGTKTAMGYGADFHSGNRLLIVETEAKCNVPNKGYYTTRGFVVEGGMSGGPVLVYPSTGGIRVGAVVVSGDNVSSGIRAVDSDVDALIRAYLD